MDNYYLKIFAIFFMISFSYSQDEEVNSAFTGSFGSVTLNDQIYNHFSFRPEMSIGKLGLGMDLYFYFDEDGKLYHDNWNFSSSENSFRTIIDKIYYIRWGQPFDDIYFRFGALPNITMGHGSLVKNYSNVIDYPRYRRKGITFNYRENKVYFQFVHSDFKEIDAPSLVAVSTSFEFVDKLKLNFTIATDPNQNKGLFDSDDDGYYDEIDENPNNENIWHEAQEIINQVNDWSSIYGSTCYDLSDTEHPVWNDNCEALLYGDDGDGGLHGDLNTFQNENNIATNKEEVSGLSFGVSYDLTSRFVLYSEFTQLFGSVKNPYPLNPYSEGLCEDVDSDNMCDNLDVIDQQYYNNYLNYNDLVSEFNDELGYGFIPFGFKATWDRIIFSFDFRQNSQNFLFHYWDQNYDNSRVNISGSNILTKEKSLYNYGDGGGVSFSLSTNIKYVGLSFSYTHMNSDIWDHSTNQYKNDDNNSIYAKFDIDTSMLNKVRIAEMFYQQRNIDSPFDFNPTEDSLFGYNVGIEMSENMVLILKGRKSYACDENNHCDPIKTTQIETQIIF